MEEQATGPPLSPPSIMVAQPDDDDINDYSSHLPLAVITPNSTSIATPSHFQLPQGWAVKRVIRSDRSRTDTMLSLDEGESNQCQLAIVPPTSIVATQPFTLPDGWVVKKVRRRFGGIIDKFYHDPETGYKFRSLREVERYINGEEYRPARYKGPRLDHRVKNFVKRKATISGGKMLRLEEGESNQYQLAIVSPTRIAGTQPFTLPDGWVVEEVPRRFGGSSDKYYYEPQTGHKFRSLREVERYMKGEHYPPTKSRAMRQCDFVEHRGKQKMVISGGKMFRLVEENFNQCQSAAFSPTSITATSSIDLPDGWVVEKVPRRPGGTIDTPMWYSIDTFEDIEKFSTQLAHNKTYYYEPRTGRQFRSLTAAKKHLTELEENSPLSVALAELREKNTPKAEPEESSPLSELKDNTPEAHLEENSPLSVALEELRENNTPLSKAFKLVSHIKNYSLLKKNISKKKSHTSTFLSPPNKINWVIASTGGDTWNAFIGDSLVPEPVKQQWAKSLMLAINDSRHNEPNSRFISQAGASI